MAVVHEAYSEVPGDGSSATTVASSSLDVPAGALGTLGVCWVDSDGTKVVSSVTDSTGNTWTAGTKARNSGTTAQQMWYCENMDADAACVVTVTFSAAVAYRSFLVDIWSGMATSSVLDVEATPATGTDTFPVTNALNTSVSDSLVVAYFASLPGTADTGSGWTSGHSITYETMEYQVFSSVQTGLTALINQGGSQPYCALAMAFKVIGAAPPPTEVVVPYDDAAIFWAPGVWQDTGTAKAANSNGSYVKFDFTGTLCRMNIEALTGLTAYPAINVFIDDRAITAITLAADQDQVNLATGLADTTHHCFVEIKAMPHGGRWDLSAALKIVSFQVDESKTISAPSGPIAERSGGTALGYGDSTLETERLVTATDPPGGADFSKGWFKFLMEAFDCEYGALGYGSQGFAQGGVGSVPQLSDAWDFYSSGASRLSGGAFVDMPDDIISMHGFNGGVDQATVEAQIEAWRAAAPDARIIMIVPPSGVSRSYITAAVAAQQTGGDANVYLVDLGSGNYQYGVDNGLSSATVDTTDGVHFNQLYSARLAAGLAAKIALIRQPHRFTVVAA